MLPLNTTGVKSNRNWMNLCIPLTLQEVTYNKDTSHLEKKIWEESDSKRHHFQLWNFQLWSHLFALLWNYMFYQNFAPWKMIKLTLERSNTNTRGSKLGQRYTDFPLNVDYPCTGRQWLPTQIKHFSEKTDNF